MSEHKLSEIFSQYIGIETGTYPKKKIVFCEFVQTIGCGVTASHKANHFSDPCELFNSRIF